jgi:hypothetical protein
MNRGPDTVAPVLSRRQAFGCLGVAGLSLGVAVLCLVLGVLCMAKHGTFECIGLWSVFPLAFLVIGLVAGAVGLQRFTTAGRGAQPAPVQPSTEWQPVMPVARPRHGPPDVIPLPARLELLQGRDGDAEQGEIEQA